MNELQRIEKPQQTEALLLTDNMACQQPATSALEKPPVTAAQAKIEAVANLTIAAYQRASLLQLTPEESKALQADFPDDAFQPGAAGKENLIYIEHAHLRDRLNTVFGLGQWAIVPRNRWAEEYRTARGLPATRIYVEAMLLIRGCFVGEAVGDMTYYPNNESTNYGDAVEGAKTAALRRCAKELGIGLQAWKKDWCAGWWERRNASRRAPSKPATPSAPATAPTAAPSRPASPAQAQGPEPTGDGGESYATVSVLTVKEVHSKPDATKKWTAYFVRFSDGFGEIEAATFDRAVADLANSLADTQETAALTVKPGRKPGTREIVSLARAGTPPDAEQPETSSNNADSEQDLIP